MMWTYCRFITTKVNEETLGSDWYGSKICSQIECEWPNDGLHVSRDQATQIAFA